jgi:hypothetical protein
MAMAQLTFPVAGPFFLRSDGDYMTRFVLPMQREEWTSDESVAAVFLIAMLCLALV